MLHCMMAFAFARFFEIMHQLYLNIYGLSNYIIILNRSQIKAWYMLDFF